MTEIPGIPRASAEALARMRSPFDAQLAAAMANYERVVATAADVQRRLVAHRVSKTSKKRELTVTVDARGRLLEVKFTGQSYRDMSAAELSKLVTETVVAAQTEAVTDVKRMVAPLSTPEVPVEEILGARLARYDDPPAD